MRSPEIQSIYNSILHYYLVLLCPFFAWLNRDLWSHELRDALCASSFAQLCDPSCLSMRINAPAEHCAAEAQTRAQALNPCWWRVCFCTFLSSLQSRSRTQKRRFQLLYCSDSSGSRNVSCYCRFRFDFLTMTVAMPEKFFATAVSKCF